MFGPVKYVIWDLDGTLVDSMPSVVTQFLQIIETVSGKKLSREELWKSFGASPVIVFRHWLPDRGQHSQAMLLWDAFEKNGLTKNDFLAFEGINEVLNALSEAKIKQALFTGRDRQGALKILSHHGWIKKHFAEDCIVTGDDVIKHKPNGEGVEKIIKIWSARPSDVLVVGDHPYDAMAAGMCGAKSAAALWSLEQDGPTKRARYKKTWEKWDSADVDLRLESPLALKRWLLGD